MSKACLGMVRKLEVAFSQLWVHFVLPSAFSACLECCHEIPCCQPQPGAALQNLLFVVLSSRLKFMARSCHVAMCVCGSVTSGSFILPNASSSHTCESIFLSFLERKKGISTFPDWKNPIAALTLPNMTPTYKLKGVFRELWTHRSQKLTKERTTVIKIFKCHDLFFQMMSWYL